LNSWRLKEEEQRLQRALETAKRRVGVEGVDIRHVIEIALQDDGAALQPGRFSVPEAVLLDPETPSFAKDPTWASLFDELRPGRPAIRKDLRDAGPHYPRQKVLAALGYWKIEI